MKKPVLWATLLAAMLLTVSCASAPPAKPAPEPVQPAPEPAQPAPEPAKPAPEPAPVKQETPAVAAPEGELAQAKSLQQKVDSLGLAEYAADEYAAAMSDLKTGEDAYDKDNAASKISLDKAIAGFNAVLSKGGPLLVAKVEDQSTSSKKAADDLKAAVAVKDQYDKAEEVFQRALKEKDAGDFEAASKSFAEATVLFDEVTKVAQEKKDTAVKSQAETQQLMSESEQKAAEAEKALKDEGFTITGGGQ